MISILVFMCVVVYGIFYAFFGSMVQGGKVINMHIEQADYYELFIQGAQKVCEFNIKMKGGYYSPYSFEVKTENGFVERYSGIHSMFDENGNRYIYNWHKEALKDINWDLSYLDKYNIKPCGKDAIGLGVIRYNKEKDEYYYDTSIDNTKKFEGYML